jgi:hypothetical protein
VKILAENFHQWKVRPLERFAVEWHQNVINGMDKEIGNGKMKGKGKRKMKRK